MSASPNQEVIPILKRHLDAFAHSYCCVTAKEPNGRIIDKGSAFFGEIGKKRFVFTAAHVLSGLSDSGGVIELQLTPRQPAGQPVSGRLVLPRTTHLDLSSVHWSNEKVDVAILEASEELRADPICDWIDLKTHGAHLTERRTSWKEFTTDTTSLPIFVTGFPRFGHVVIEDKRTEITSFMPMPCYIQQLADTAAPILPSGRGGDLVIHADFNPREHENAGPVERVAAERLTNDESGAVLGGYSGGPAVEITSRGCIVLGVIREGRKLFGHTTRFSVAPLDEVLLAARLASAQPPKDKG